MKNLEGSNDKIIFDFKEYPVQMAKPAHTTEPNNLAEVKQNW